MKFVPWKKNIYFIAEAGVNHNGKYHIAKKMIKFAKRAGADAVKFQTWVEGELTGKFTQKVGYVKKNFKTKANRYEISKKLSLSFSEFKKLKKYAKKIKIDFLSTACGVKSLNFVSDELRAPYLKIGSSELNNLQFLSIAAKKKKPIILSTGMGNLKEVKNALKIIKKSGGKNLPVVVLQCTSQYPCPAKNINLNVIKTYQKNLKVDVGLSDHSLGFEAAICSAALGAKVIEKHFTLNKNFKGPDHKASLHVKDLKNLIEMIKNTSTMMGSFQKKPTTAELKIMPQVRRGIVASRNLSKGTALKRSDFTFKRPATGLSMSEAHKIINKKLNRRLKLDEPIKLSHLQ